MKKLVTLFLAIGLLVACGDNAPNQSDSMRRIAKAEKNLLNWQQKIEQQITPEVLAKPQAHIPAIYFAFELLTEAEKVYPKAQIQTAPPERYVKTRQQLYALAPQLASYGVTILEDILARTQEYRKQVEALKVAQQLIGGKANVRSLANNFNQQIDACCIADLYKVSLILEMTDATGYPKLQQQINAIESQILTMIRDADAIIPFQQSVSQLRKQYPKLD